MGFSKKYITNKNVISAFNRGGVEEIKKLYVSKCDVIITESGIASDLSIIFNDKEWEIWDPITFNDIVIEKIHKSFGFNDDIKK